MSGNIIRPLTVLRKKASMKGIRPILLSPSSSVENEMHYQSLLAERGGKEDVEAEEG